MEGRLFIVKKAPKWAPLAKIGQYKPKLRFFHRALFLPWATLKNHKEALLLFFFFFFAWKDEQKMFQMEQKMFANENCFKSNKKCSKSNKMCSKSQGLQNEFYCCSPWWRGIISKKCSKWNKRCSRTENVPNGTKNVQGNKKCSYKSKWSS